MERERERERKRERDRDRERQRDESFTHLLIVLKYTIMTPTNNY